MGLRKSCWASVVSVTSPTAPATLACACRRLEHAAPISMRAYRPATKPEGGRRALRGSVPADRYHLEPRRLAPELLTVRLSTNLRASSTLASVGCSPSTDEEAVSALGTVVHTPVDTTSALLCPDGEDVDVADRARVVNPFCAQCRQGGKPSSPVNASTLPDFDGVADVETPSVSASWLPGARSRRPPSTPRFVVPRPSARATSSARLDAFLTRTADAPPVVPLVSSSDGLPAAGPFW